MATRMLRLPRRGGKHPRHFVSESARHAGRSLPTDAVEPPGYADYTR
jgi:hypothetical protein